MTEDKKIMAFFGHHKGATTWICSIIHPVAALLGRNYANYYHTRLFDYDLKKALTENNIRFFSYTNAEFKYVKEVAEDIKGFHVVRDPRDMCVSAYFSHLHSHPTEDWPELVGHRQKLEQLSEDEGLLAEIEFRRLHFDQMNSWDYSLDNILELRMEDLTAWPYEGMLEIFEFLGAIDHGDDALSIMTLIKERSIHHLGKRLGVGSVARDKISPVELLAIVYDNRFEKKAGKRKKGVENARHHYRKGVAGDWVNHFKKEHVELFKANYNDLLLKLGYEEDEDWDKKYELGR